MPAMETPLVGQCDPVIGALPHESAKGLEIAADANGGLGHFDVWRVPSRKGPERR